MEGVHGYYDHEDIPGENEFGAIIKDEEIFASELVTCVGQQIGVVVAETEAQARLAAKAVKVEYEDVEGAVFSCEEAIAANSYIEVTASCTWFCRRVSIGTVTNITTANMINIASSLARALGVASAFWAMQRLRGSLIKPSKVDFAVPL